MPRFRSCLVLAAFAAVVSGFQDREYRAVLVEEARVTPGNRRVVAALSTTFCAFFCLLDPQCRSFCFDGDLCHITDYLLSVNYLRANANEPTTWCYTSRKNNAALHAPVQALNPSKYGPVASLVDGIFTQQGSECYRSKSPGENFVSIDLGKPTQVNEIIIYVWIMTPSHTREIEIFLESQDPIVAGTLANNTAAIANTSHLKRVNNEYVVPVSPPRTARWIALFKNWTNIMGLCSVEVY